LSRLREAAQLPVGEAEMIIAFGKVGIGLDGVPKMDLRLKVFFLFSGCFPLSEVAIAARLRVLLAARPAQQAN
jgi:hypothetical protein